GATLTLPMMSMTTFSTLTIGPMGNFSVPANSTVTVGTLNTGAMSNTTLNTGSQLNIGGGTIAGSFVSSPANAGTITFTGSTTVTGSSPMYSGVTNISGAGTTV